MCYKRVVLLAASLFFGIITAHSQVTGSNASNTLTAPGSEQIVQAKAMGQLSANPYDNEGMGVFESSEGNALPDTPSRRKAKPKIVYCCVKGPEVSMMIRDAGVLKNGKAVIELPEHYAMVTSEEGLTAQITPAGRCNGIFIKELTTRKLVVEELQNGTSNVRFFYLIQGIQKGYEDYTVFKSPERKVGPDCR